MGRFFVIDGLDGSGKETQTGILAQYLQEKGEEVRTLSYPRYGMKGCIPVEMYLGGELGSHPEDTGAYAASTLFAVDRYLSYRTEWKEDYEKGKILLANRYTTSNAVHQLSKLPKEQWEGFLSWLWDFEYTKLGIPHPDRILYLEMRPDLSRRLIEARSVQTGVKKDIHESDAGYLDRCYEAAIYASDRLGWTKIRCFEDDTILTREEIARKIREALGV